MSNRMAGIRKNPPEPLAAVPFSLPTHEVRTLSNGAKLVILPDSRLPIFSIRILFPFGDIHDPENNYGFGSALASMVMEGTSTRSSRELAERIERLGASMGMSCGSDSSIASTAGLSLYFSELLGLLSEIILSPSFPESELNLYKTNTTEGLRFQRSQAGFLADERFAAEIYGQASYSRVSPSPEDVEAISREQLLRFAEERLLPGDAVILVAGDVDVESAVREIESRFNGWVGSPSRVDLDLEVIERISRSTVIVDRKGSAQANIVLGNIAVPRLHEDFFSLLVLNQVLGAGASSRLFMNLREEKGYTYGAYSKFNMRKFSGDFEATAEVRTEVTGASVKEFMYELDRIRSQAVTESELRDAKNYLTGVFPLRAETLDGFVGLLANQYIYGLPDDYLVTYRERVKSVSAEDVLIAAQKHIRPNQLSMVIVGDADSVIPQIDDWSEEVRVYDVDGKERSL